MCDFSLQSVKSRPAAVGDKLTTHNFGTGTRGFVAVDDDLSLGHCATAVCVLPGTELAFDEPIEALWGGKFGHSTAIFRQVNTDQERAHHDAIEFPDGKKALLTGLREGQRATVLQLPAQPRNEQEAKDQTRLEVVG